MPRIYLFLLLVAAMSLFVFLSSYILVYDGLYYSSLGEQFSYEQIKEMLQQGRKYEWLGYVLLPVMLLIKITFVASCLSIGLFFSANKFEFKKLFGVALEAEFVFLIPTILKVLWFAFVQTNYSLKDLQLFYPLSALNFFDAATLQPWWVYPLQLLNVFEAVYWVVLIKNINRISPFGTERRAGLGATASYGVGLLLWVAVVMFISVSYSS